MSQHVLKYPKSPLQTHRCSNGLVYTKEVAYCLCLLPQPAERKRYGTSAGRINQRTDTLQNSCALAPKNCSKGRLIALVDLPIEFLSSEFVGLQPLRQILIRTQRSFFLLFDLGQLTTRGDVQIQVLQFDVSENTAIRQLNTVQREAYSSNGYIGDPGISPNCITAF